MLHERAVSLINRVRERLGVALGNPRSLPAAPSVPARPEPIEPVLNSPLVPEPPVDVIVPAPPDPIPPFTPSVQKTIASLVVYGLGHLRVFCDDRPVENWPSKKGKAVFKFIVSYRDQPTPKDVLMETFWPQAAPSAARNNLNVAIHGLRKALKEVRPDYNFILYEDGSYLINPALQVWVDFEQFMANYECALDIEQNQGLQDAQSAYEKAVSLYQADFLEGDLYEDWTVVKRERLRSAYMDALDRLSRIHFSEGHYAQAVTLCELILDRDDCREDAHRLLMRCYARQGAPPLALRQYQACVDALRKELDVHPATMTTQLYEQIRRGERV